MPGIIAIGDVTKRQEFIDSIIAEYSILPYNTTFFDTSLKIADVRELIKKLSIKSRSDEKRLIVIKASVSVESQNALLKTLEELSGDTFIIFSAEDKNDYLPTVISRCLVKNFNSGDVNNDTQRLLPTIERLRENLLQEKGAQSTALIIAEMLEKHEGKSYSDFIICLREELLQYTTLLHNKGLLVQLCTILKELNRQAMFVEKNNGNERMTLENSILSVLH